MEAVSWRARWRDSWWGRQLLALGGAEAALTLHHRRIYTLPTRPGLLYLAMLLVLLLSSINYQLSLGFLLTFVLAAVTWVGLHLTFSNQAGLHLRALKAEPVFAGERACFEIELSDVKRRYRYALVVTGPLNERHLNLAPDGHRRLGIECDAAARGRLAAPRLKVHTIYPLGVWIAWSYWQPDLYALVYPAPEPTPPPLPGLAAHGDGEHAGGPGHESLSALRNYQPGDSPRMIAWRAAARSANDTLSTKTFEGASVRELWLDAQALPVGLPLEDRLSRLCAWVLDADRRGLRYGVRLNDSQCVAPSTGDEHRHRCLEMLALFQTEALA